MWHKMLRMNRKKEAMTHEGKKMLLTKTVTDILK